MSTVIEAQLPGGKPLPSHMVPKFAMRHTAAMLSVG